MTVATTIASRRAGILRVLLIGLPILLIVLVVAWIALLPTVVKSQVQSKLGFPTEAARVSVNPFGATVLLEDFRLQNPEPFPVRDFVDLALLDLRVKPMSLRAEVLEIPRLVVDLKKITLVTTKDGQVNATLFKKKLDEALGPSEGELKFHVGVLELRLGQVEMIDYSAGETPQRRTFDLGVNRTFTDVTDPTVVAKPIVGDILKANAAGLASGLSSLVPGEYGDALTEAFSAAGTLLGDPGAALGKDGEALRESAKKLIESLKSDSKP